MADWMAFNVADYTANTLHLTTRQHGAYILLICAAWAGKGTLPGSDASLMAIAKLTPREWQTDGAVIKAFLTRRGDAWIHERVAICGHRGDYPSLDDWDAVEWSRGRLTYGGGKTTDSECIWYSPACLPAESRDLFANMVPA